MKGMDRQYVKKLNMPDNPGVYFFRDAEGRPLYIGRATSLHDRVVSYFSNDLISTRGMRIVDMVAKSKEITWQEVDSVLEAILLESELIKKYQPYYNVDERDDKSGQYVIFTAEDWPRIIVMRARDYDKKKAEDSLPFEVNECFGPFTNASLIRQALKILRGMFPFRDEKSVDPRHERFYRTIGRSPESVNINSKEDYRKNIENLILIFKGRKSEVKKNLKKEMTEYAKNMEFEKAVQTRNLLSALDHIRDTSLIKRDRDLRVDSFRLEAYDIAHLAGSNVVGAMTASFGGVFEKSAYRKFRLSKQVNDDVANLGEIVFRRFGHTEWPFPDAIIVDGGENQMNRVKAVLKSLRIDIPVIAVKKDKTHKAAELIGDKAIIKKWKNEIIALNAECHRFVIAFHRQRRDKGFII